MSNVPPIIQELADSIGAEIESCEGPLSDGSGFATMSMPLPSDHWLYAEGHNEPPAPLRIDICDRRTEFADQVKAATRYAVRASTMNGKSMDFDPDAMVQNMLVGLLGYWTPDGTSKL